MRSPLALAGAAALLALLGRTVASADSFTPIDVSSYLNDNISNNPQTLPVGTSTGNQGTVIPFNIGPHGDLPGMWLAWYTGSQTLDVSVHVSGQSSFYALLNNFYGTAGANEYNITIRATNGDSVTYQSIGGADTRDYNHNPSTTNTVANTTTPWFDNGLGQRLDVRQFTLPSSFATETVSDFIITQVNGNDPAVFSGLTFSTAPGSFTGTPEPLSFALAAAGLLVIGASRRYRSVPR